MIYDHIGGIRDPLKQDLIFEFCRNQSKIIIFLTETHINHHQIHHIQNNWLQLFLSWRWSHKRMLVLLHLCLEGITVVETDTKGRFKSFKVVMTEFDRVLCGYALSGYSNREQLARGCFFEGLQSYMENKTKGNENKIIYGDFNCT